jgi:hypothetical protein
MVSTRIVEVSTGDLFCLATRGRRNCVAAVCLGNRLGFTFPAIPKTPTRCPQDIPQ